MGWKNESSKDAFISDMKANGFSQDEIDREVANIEGTQPPAPAAPPAAPPKPASAQPSPDPFVLNPAAPAETLKQMGEARAQQGNTLIGSTMPSGGVWPPNEQNAALYALPVVGLAGYGLYKGAQEIGTGLKNKFFGPSVSEKPPVEPAMLPQAAQQPVTHEQWLASLSPEERTLYARSREAKAAATAATQPLGEWGNIRFDNTEPKIVNDRVGMSSPVGNQPVVPAQTPTKAAEAIVTPVAPVEPAPAPAPAPAPTKEAAEAPKPKPVKPPEKPKLNLPEGWGKGMTWLANQHGVEGAQAFIDKYNNGKPYATYDEMMKAYQENTMRPKYSDIPKSIRKERGITSRSGALAVPPPSLQAAPGLATGGSLIRSLTDPLQLKQ